MLKVENLSVSFQQYGACLKKKTMRTISNVSIELEGGEILAVVGASGSGKSVLAHALLGILPENAIISGAMYYQGEIMSEEKRQILRGKEIVFVPQSVNYLDPLMRVGKQVRYSSRKKDKVSWQRRIFARYRLKPETENLYPFQLSGGMARRVLLAAAMAGEAKVMIADEPTPGLDPALSTEVVQSLREFAGNGGAVMLITHDIESALKIAHKIAVFYCGTVVEIAPAENFSGDGARLRHPYSQALWKALPQNDFIPIPGSQPQPGLQPSGCVFASRCLKATLECQEKPPKMKNIREGMVSCIHAT